MLCEEESTKTFQSLGGQLTSLDGIKIQKELLLHFIYECSMKDVLTFYKKFRSLLPENFQLFLKFNCGSNCGENSKKLGI
jgi:hypothetical protein